MEKSSSPENPRLPPETEDILPPAQYDIEESALEVLYQAALHVYSSPLPPADEMVKYERLLSGSAERILLMAERAQHAMIKQRERKDRASLSGLYIGTLTFWATIVLGAYIVMHADNGWQGGFALALIAAPVMKVLLEQLRK